MPFVSFEGIEGSGKSTQIARLAQRVGSRALATREPGGTAIGASIRELLLDPANRSMDATTELLLYFADRAQHVVERVRPALAEGRLVLCDRYVQSSLAYQGFGRGLPLARIRQLAEIATGGLQPDVIVLLDLPVEVGLGRVGRRGGRDRLEREVVAFHERVRHGFLSLLAEEPSRWLRLDASLAEESVFGQLWAGLAARSFVAEATA